MIARILLPVLLLLSAAPTFSAAQEGPYLYDLLSDASYLSAWNGMLAGEDVPDWVSGYATDFNGPTSPSSEVPVGGEMHTLAWVCKAHDCGDNQLYVLFAPGGAQAWGYLITGGDHTRFLGGPNAAIQDVLLNAVR
jgi:inhibitor of lysozyme (Ivy)